MSLPLLILACTRVASRAELRADGPIGAFVFAVLGAEVGEQGSREPWPQITISTGDQKEYRADGARPATCPPLACGLSVVLGVSGADHERIGERGRGSPGGPVASARCRSANPSVSWLDSIRIARSKVAWSAGAAPAPLGDSSIVHTRIQRRCIWATGRAATMLSSWPDRAPVPFTRSVLPRMSSRLSPVWWPAIALGGLLVGLIALGSEPGRDTVEGPATRLLIELPHLVVTLASVAGSLSILLWFAFLLALARRKKREGEPERGLWATLLFALLVTGAALLHREMPEGMLFPWSGLPNVPHPPAGLAGRQPPPLSLPFFTSTVGALIVVAALASLAFAGFIVFGDRLAEWWRRAPSGTGRPLVVAVDDSLGDLSEEADARLAIIRCYRRFEVALARSRVPRSPWQTPLEFMRDALARLPLPSDAVEQLTRLFERARFSNEPLGRAERDSAWASLVAIRGSLEADTR